MKKVIGLFGFLSAILLISYTSGYAFELNGFVDVSYTKSTEGATEYRNGDFAFGTLDLYLAETMEDIEILVELIVEQGNVLDLERVTLGYTFNDALKLRVGRFHTPLGFWNTAYHHGVQLQTTILRPDFLTFEDDGGILPTHAIGVMLTGRLRTGLGAIEYNAIVGNGSTIVSEGGADVLAPNNISDNNNGKALALNLALSPKMIKGLKTGLSGFVSRVQDSGASSPVDVDQTIWGVAFSYSIINLGLAGEYFSITNDNNLASGSDSNDAYYGLISYTYREKWIPYLMYEDLSADKDDPYFTILGTKDTTKTTAGLRYNINYRSSLKGEVRLVDKADEDWQEYAVQWALAF